MTRVSPPPKPIGTLPLFNTSDEDFDAKNPGVYEAFARASREAKDSGLAHYSAYTIRERIRWHFNIEKGDRDFKFNNNWTPYLARRIMRDDSRFIGFFVLRRSDRDAE